MQQQIPVGPPRFARRLSPPLVGADAVDFWVLTRVKAGVVTRYAGCYFDDYKPFPRYGLAALYFDGLLAVEMVTIGQHPALPGLETVTLADAGHARLNELVARCNRRTLT